eukprot:maker-scaffold_34-snap-gene-0.6-mRNA-1 protein AED:0.50 eAED:0.50 QI:104/1/0.5/1/1/1/2/0/733
MNKLAKKLTARERPLNGGKTFMPPIIDIYTPAYEKRAVISIDFGSTHCGIAYSLVNLKQAVPETYKDENVDLRDYLEDPEPLAKNYRGSHSKQPTCALFSKETEQLVEFGFSARETYLTYVADESHEKLKNLMYFEGSSIKMRLWDAVYDFKASVSSVDGENELPMKTLVSQILRFLRKEALELAGRGAGDLSPEECLWVLTVPSIWKEGDKQFMRQAAFDAGIIQDVGSSDLILALEPECAVIAASHALKGFSKDDKVLVFDCGGGTVDVCAVQVLSQKFENVDQFQNLSFGEKDISHRKTLENFTPLTFGSEQPGVLRLRHLLQPTGGDWGSTYIDKNFVSFLSVLFEDTDLARIREADVSAVIELIELFEIIKESVEYKEYKSLKGTRLLNMTNVMEALRQWSIEEKEPFVPLQTYVDRYNALCEKKKNGLGGLTVVQETNLCLPMGLVASFFQNVVERIVEEMLDLIDKEELEGLNYVLMVGGFAECKVLKMEVYKKLKNTGIRLLIPKRPSTVVQIGAVHYGFDPNIISTRRVRQTIGVKTRVPLRGFKVSDEVKASARFQSKIYLDSKTGTEFVKDVFHAYIEKGNEVRSSQIEKRTFHSAPGKSSKNSKSKKSKNVVKFVIYATDSDQTPIFIDEPGCIKMGELSIPLGRKGKVECEMSFASTEIIIQIRDENNPSNKKMLQFSYNNVGISNSSADANDTLVMVPVRRLDTWGADGFDSHSMSEML